MKKINIPVWGIVVSFILGIWPLAVALIILKVISESGIANDLIKKYDYSAVNGNLGAEAEQPRRKKREKKPYSCPIVWQRPQ